MVLDAALQLMDRAAECSKAGLATAATALCRAAERALDALRVRSDDPLPTQQHENPTAVRQQLTRITTARKAGSIFDHRIADSCVLDGVAAASRARVATTAIGSHRYPGVGTDAVDGARALRAHCGTRFTVVDNFCPLCGTARPSNVSSLHDNASLVRE